MPHVTFIHGIANKPTADKLLEQWLHALAQDPLGNDDSLDLGAAGVTSSMVYWADVLYDKADVDEAAAQEALIADGAYPTQLADMPDKAWREHLPATEQQMVTTLEAKLMASSAVEELSLPRRPVGDDFERIPLPWVLKRYLMERFLRDVHHYLFNVRYSPRPGAIHHVQDTIRERLISALQHGGKQEGLHVLVCHSMGTVIAYDCLTRVADCPPVDGLMTIGSPLGLDEVQDKLLPVGASGRFSATNAFPQRVRGSWVNIYDPLDFVTGFDGDIANDFLKEGKPAITVIREDNRGVNRHNVVKYLSGPLLRAALRKQLGI